MKKSTPVSPEPSGNMTLRHLLSSKITAPVAVFLVLGAFGIGVVVERDIQHSIHSGDVCDFATANENFASANESDQNAVAANVYQLEGGTAAAASAASDIRLKASLISIWVSGEAGRACGVAVPSAISPSPMASP